MASYGGDGYLPVEVGATRVYFDNVAAPMIYSLSQQVSVVAPYEISVATQVQVEYAGLRSQPVSIPVNTTAPGIYCYAGGTGQAVAINTYADQTVAYNQARPATPGSSYLTFFITGEGATAAPWADGFLPVAPLFPKSRRAGQRADRRGSQRVFRELGGADLRRRDAGERLCSGGRAHRRHGSAGGDRGRYFGAARRDGPHRGLIRKFRTPQQWPNDHVLAFRIPFASARTVRSPEKSAWQQCDLRS